MFKTNSAALRKSVLIATVCSFGLAVTLPAATFNYGVGNVLIGFRKVQQSPLGASASGTNLVVNAGPISYFTNLAPNTKVTITNYTGGQLSQVGTNSIGWSAFAYFDGAPVPNTLFITAPRDVLNTQTSPNNCPTSSANNLTLGQMGAIANGAADNGAFSPLNTSNAVLMADGFTFATDVSYYQGVGANFDFNGTFTFNFEKYTPANFITAGNPVRADFYAMPPAALHSSVPATYLGYFELGTNGVMTYTAYPTATVAAPVIISFTRTNAISYVKFTTGSSGTYTLRGTNSTGLTVARTNWPAISSVGGNGSINTLTDTTTSSNKFYVITAQ
jgi:hypothetical protein